MPYLSRFALILSAPLVIAALLACAAPAGAMLSTNKQAANGIALTNVLATNGIAQTGAAASARIVSGPALAELNGVAVEAVIVPDALLR